MKKFFVAVALFILTAVSVYAEAEVKLFPDKLYAPSGVMTASDSTGTDLKQELMDYLCGCLQDTPEKIDVARFKIAINPEFAAQNNITITDAQITYDEFFDIFISAVWAVPEAGRILTGLNGYTYYNTGSIAEIYPMYVTAPYDDEEFETEINYILSTVISPDMNDTQKLLALHDYLADSCVYNLEATKKSLNPADEDSYAYTAYGAIVKKTCVCQGYSFALKLLCDRLNIDCGYATNPTHMWNIARAADGKYYHIDITFDDPLFTNKSGYIKNPDGSFFQAVYHTNFLTDSESIYDAHSNTAYTESSSTVSTTYDTGNSLFYVADSLAETFPWYNLTGAIFWQDGSLWQHNTGVGNSFYSTAKLLKYTGNSYSNVEASKFPANRHLSGQIFNINDDYVALKGLANSSATFFEVSFDNGLKSVKSTPITFDEKGRAFAKIQNPSSKLILLSRDFTPVAYARQANITLW